ncbi:MAG: hypothetical protein IJ729_07135, partial [Alloprevotella sp.]|nr:hypothetical protein [Alloprevotella sp.]
MSKRRPYIFIYIIGLLALALLSACQPTRFISEPDTLLRSVRLESASKQVNPSDFRPYVRQEPNARWFSIAKVPLSLYCLSPADTTRRRGRFFRRVGEAPVVYDASLAEYSRQALQSALQAKGYVHATVTADTVTRRRKTDVTYRLQPGRRYYVREVRRAYDDDSVKVSVERSNGNSLLYRGMPLDVSLLTEERARIVSQLQNEGFYRVHKEFVSYRVDTIRDDTGVELTLQVARPVGIDSNKVYERFRFRNVTLREHGVEGAETDSLGGGSDELVLTPQHGLSAFGSYREAKRFFSALPPRVAGIRRAVLLNHVPLRPDSLFRERDFQSSYSGLNALQALNYSTIRLREVPGDSALLDAEVGLVPGKPHSVSAELEGTNTSGDLGAAVSLTYSNRNLFRGAEVLSLKVRGAYEAITGLEGYSDENYFEYGAEASLRFPAHRLPFLPRRQRRHLKATSDIRLMYDSQNRPEFHRRVLTGNCAYRWNQLAHP